VELASFNNGVRIETEIRKDAPEEFEDGARPGRETGSLLRDATLGMKRRDKSWTEG